MEEVRCPICGAVVGMVATERYSFYHCGESFPKVEVFDFRVVASDISIPIQDRESQLRRYVRNMDRRLTNLEKDARVELYAAREALKNLCAQHEAVAVMTHSQPAKLTISNMPKMKLIIWHFTLVAHAKEHGLETPEQTFDSCKAFATAHKLVQPL